MREVEVIYHRRQSPLTQTHADERYSQVPTDMHSHTHTQRHTCNTDLTFHFNSVDPEHSQGFPVSAVGSQKVPQVCIYNMIWPSQANSLEIIKQQRPAEEDSGLHCSINNETT